jgi:hypothetical protein
MKAFFLTVLGLFVCCFFAVSGMAGPEDYFKIRVIDESTGGGIPMVKLTTTSNVVGYTDSNGFYAFREPGLMDLDVFFTVESDGYRFAKDGFGFSGKALHTAPGGSVELKMERLNIAERVYRVTGQGIYRDSVLLEEPVPIQHPAINGLVVGQDSVDNTIYRGRLFWMWGDTSWPGYPLGHFKMAGAYSDLPGRGGLDPAAGVDLEYFVGPNGFSRPVCPLKEDGLVWLDARFARLKGLSEPLERGLVLWNDETEAFEPIYRTGPDNLPYPDFGHAFRVRVNGQDYHYFATPFPLSVRLRVPARFGAVTDIDQYEVLTTLEPLGGAEIMGEVERLRPGGRSYHWVRFGDLYGDGRSRSAVIEALAREKKDLALVEVGTGAKLVPHGGSVFYNEYLDQWIMIFVRIGGADSFLGEVYFASAPSPLGPWRYAVKVATHHEYTFYNPKQHPYFDQAGGRLVYFEGTYSMTFSKSNGRPVPRYDYNQLMYRLDLSDARLELPDARGGAELEDGVLLLFEAGVERIGR